MAQYPVPAVGQRLTAEFVASMLPITARKAAATARISTTALTADPDLAIAVDANATYKVTALLLYDSAVAADFKWAFTGPAGFTGDYSYSAIQTGSAAGSYADDQNGYAAIAATPAVGGGAANVEAINIWGNFTTSGTSGTFTLTWAQNTSTASNTTLRAGSYLELTRIG